MIRLLQLSTCLALVAGVQNPAPKFITGTFNENLTSEGMAQIELRLSTSRDLPGIDDDDRVFKANTPQFRPPGAPDGLAVAFVETKTGTLLFVDVDRDGRFTERERFEYGTATQPVPPREVTIDLPPVHPGDPTIAFRCRVVGLVQHFLQFTAGFRAEGYADIGGRRTLVSLPFNVGSGTVGIRRGMIGVDANGDGRIDFAGLSGSEAMFANGDRVMFHVGDHYVSFESADFSARTFVLREHAAEEYVFIEVRAGEPLPDFAFTDFNGRARRLSEFKGKYVLLDFWGTWCGPCVAEIPTLKAADARFRDRGFEILGIDYEHGEITPAVRDSVHSFLKAHDVPWTNATPDSVKELVENRLRILGFPTHLLLDRAGRVVSLATTGSGSSDLLDALERTIRK
ncbi:MAG: TlpA family protein disulfide reductase [Acidobacteriota bacterium]